jgi:hypothetical protein
MGNLKSAPSLLEVTTAMGNMTSAPVAATDHSSDGRLSSRFPSLLQTTVAMGDFCSSQLCYHCSDAVLAMGQMPVATVDYGPLPQSLFVVVVLYIDLCLVLMITGC